MLNKCGRESVGEGEVGKKTKTTPGAGPLRVGNHVSEKSQVTHACKNPYERSSSK